MKDERSANGHPGELVFSIFRKDDPRAASPFALRPEQYVRPREGQSPLVSTFDWSEETLDRLSALFVLRDLATPVEAKAKRMAEILDSFLRPLGFDEVERDLRQRLSERANGPPVQITLRFGAPELFALPWELLRCSGRETEIGRHDGVLLRYEQMSDRGSAQPVIDPPPEGGNVLFAWSDAGGKVKHDEHIGALAEGLGRTRDGLEKDQALLEAASLDRIDVALGSGRFSVLHLLCHGAMSSYSDGDRDVLSPCLVLHSKGGREERVTPAALGRLLEKHAGAVRLVVLSACRGAGGGDLDNTLGSPALKAHGAGIPAVLGARYLLPIEDSIEMTRVLYRALALEGRSLEEAIPVVRKYLNTHPLSWSSLLFFAREADGEDHRPIVPLPYFGLRKLKDKDEPWLFGRSAEKELGLTRLRALVDESPSAPRFLMVSGAPGSGKSSFVAAGLLPAWLRTRREGPKETWTVIALSGDKLSLAPILAALSGDKHVVVWIDQVEKVFSSEITSADRDTFFQQIWQLAQGSASRMTVIAACRIDFFDRLGEIRLDSEGLTLEEVSRDPAHALPLFRMRTSALREIIAGPAARAGIEIEPGLTDILLEDVEGSPNAHVLLEYVLNLLWEKRARSGQRLAYKLTHAAYREIGGASGALARRADSVIAALSEVEKRAARRLMTFLVEVHEKGAQDKKRRVPQSALPRGPDEEAAVQPSVLQALREAQLIVVDEVPEQGGIWGVEDNEVEIASDMLLRSWGLLRVWLDEDRAKNLAIRDVERWAREMADDPNAVLSASRLAAAEDVYAHARDDLSAEARALVERSAAAREAAKLREEAEKKRTEDQLRRARSLALIATAQEVFATGDTATACLLLGEVPEPGVGVAAGSFERLARRVLDAGIPVVTMRGHEGPVTHVSIDPGRRFLLTAGRDATVRLWTPEGRNLHTFKHEKPIETVSLDHKGRLAVVAYEGGGASLWDAWTGAFVTTLPMSAGAATLRSVDFSFDDQHIIGLDASGNVLVWSASGKPVAQLYRNEKALVCLACGLGDTLVLGREDGEVWGVSARSRARWLIARHEGKVHALSMRSDGQWVISASEDETARVTAVEGPPNLATLHHQAPVLTACFHPDGVTAGTGTAAGTAHIWTLDDSRAPVILRHKGPVRELTFSFWQRSCVTASDDGTARVWSQDGPFDPIVFRGHTAAPVAVAFSADSGLVITGGLDHRAIVWTGSDPVRLEGHEGAVWSVGISADRARAITGSEDGTARLWDLTGKDPHRVFHGHKGAVRAVALSPDGKLFATGSDDRQIALWEAGGTSPLVVLSGHDGPITRLRFSSSGEYVVSCSTDGTARIWALPRPGEAPRVIREKAPLADAELSADGSCLLIRDHTGNMSLVRTDGSERKPLGSSARCAALTDEGGIVGYLNDKTVIIVQQQQRLLELPLHHKPVTAAAISPDLQMLATTSEDLAVRLWAIGPRLLKERLQNASRDSLSPMERQLWLDETEEEALRGWTASERRNGRDPAAS